MVDASIYLYAGMRHHGPTLCDPNGEPCGALHGLVDALGRVCESGARRVVCAFDGAREQLARRQLYPAYKAHRPAVSDVMQAQRARAPALVQSLGFSGWLNPTYEADDIIATLARRSRELACAVVVVSADRDLLQVLRPGDEFWNLSAGSQLSYTAASRKLRLKPEQLSELLALCGDVADNVPGVPGVTRHVAVRLIRRWGDVDAVLANLDAISRSKLPRAEALVAALRDHADQIMLARELTRMQTVPDVCPRVAPPPSDRETRHAIYTALDLEPVRVAALERRFAL